MSAKGGFFDIHSHCTTRRPTKAAARCKLDSVMSHLGSRMRSTCDRTRLQQHRYRFCAGAERSTNGRPRGAFRLTVSCKLRASSGIWLRVPSGLMYSR